MADGHIGLGKEAQIGLPGGATLYVPVYRYEFESVDELLAEIRANPEESLAMNGERIIVESAPMSVQVDYDAASSEPLGITLTLRVLASSY